MDIQSIIEFSGGGLFALLTLLQISPLEIKPWSFLFRAFGKAINGEVVEELADIKDELADLKAHDTRQDEERERDKALDARRRILQFGDDCRRGVEHSKEHFDSIFDDIHAYQKHCREHPDFENDKAVLTIQKIEAVYKNCMDKNVFL